MKFTSKCWIRQKKKKIKNKSRIPINIHMINVFSVNSIQNWQYIFWADSLIKPKSIKKKRKSKKQQQQQMLNKISSVYVCLCLHCYMARVICLWKKANFLCFYGTCKKRLICCCYIQLDILFRCLVHKHAQMTRNY